MAENEKDSLSCFKAYDIRGRVPDELDEELAFKIGQAYSAHFSPTRIAIGYDIRLSSPALAEALGNGFLQAGVDIIDLGQCGTEEIYFAAFSLDVDGAVIVTASHNPADYNGMKLVRKGAVPISGDSGLLDLKRLVAQSCSVAGKARGKKSRLNNRPAYIQHILGYVDIPRLRPLKIVVNSGNGCAGPVLDMLEEYLPFEFIKLQHDPDGHFPNGVPNPLLPENREITSLKIKETGADLGIAWDGDFDRCFIFDENGGFCEGYYIVALLARVVLAKETGGKIIHDPRLVWNTREVVEGSGGVAVMCKTGHAFIKERMRKENVLYGGEMSSHHYFRDFAYCDSGMIPWLLIAEILSRSAEKLSTVLGGMMEKYPVSGELNFRVSDPEAAISRISTFYQAMSPEMDFTDGLSMAFPEFRFNVRLSNTEPLLRLNVETRGNQPLLTEKTDELQRIIQMAC